MFDMFEQIFILQAALALLLPLIVASDSGVPFTAFGGVHYTAPVSALHHAVHAAPVISHHVAYSDLYSDINPILTSILTWILF